MTDKKVRLKIMPEVIPVSSYNCPYVTTGSDSALSPTKKQKREESKHDVALQGTDEVDQVVIRLMRPSQHPGVFRVMGCFRIELEVYSQFFERVSDDARVSVGARVVEVWWPLCEHQDGGADFAALALLVSKITHDMGDMNPMSHVNDKAAAAIMLDGNPWDLFKSLQPNAHAIVRVVQYLMVVAESAPEVLSSNVFLKLVQAISIPMDSDPHCLTVSVKGFGKRRVNIAVCVDREIRHLKLKENKENHREFCENIMSVNSWLLFELHLLQE